MDFVQFMVARPQEGEYAMLKLNREEREKFFELIYKLASCDGVFREEEQELIEGCRRELDIRDNPDTGSFENLADYFGRCDDRVKKIVLFEVCGIILADNEVGENEQKDNEVGENEQKAFDYLKEALAVDEQEEIISIANDLKLIQDRIKDIVFGG